MVAQCLLKKDRNSGAALSLDDLYSQIKEGQIIDLNIIVYKSEKVHYTTNLTDKFGKVMVWKV